MKVGVDLGIMSIKKLMAVKRRGRPPSRFRTKEQVSVRFDPDILAALKRHADSIGLAVGTVVRLVMKQYLETKEK